MGSSTGYITYRKLDTLKEVAVYNVPLKVEGMKSSGAVQEIIYSPGEDVFLVIRADGQIFLYGSKLITPRMHFEKPQGEVCRAVWIDSVSGDFLVASERVGTLRVYNAAQPACKEIIKVSRHGIYDLVKMTSEVYLVKLKNGQIMQFNIKTKKTLFMTDVGHSH